MAWLESEKVRCRFCKKKITKGHLETHERQHTGPQPFKCHFCSKKYYSLSALTVHKKRIHFPSQETKSIQRKQKRSIRQRALKLNFIPEEKISPINNVTNKKKENKINKTTILQDFNNHNQIHFKEKQDCNDSVLLHICQCLCDLCPKK